MRSTQVEGKRRRLRHVGCRLRHTLSSTAQPGKGAGEGQQQRGTTSRARLQNGRAAPRTGVRSVLNTRAASMPAQTQRQSESLTQRFGIRGAYLGLTPRQELYRHDACPPRPPSPAHPPCRLRLRIVLHSSLWPSQSACWHAWSSSARCGRLGPGRNQPRNQATGAKRRPLGRRAPPPCRTRPRRALPQCTRTSRSSAFDTLSKGATQIAASFLQAVSTPELVAWLVWV